MPTPGARLRSAMAEGPIMIPGAFNALTAKIAEGLGFRAVYFSGGALSAGWAGLPDVGIVTQAEFAAEAGVIAAATALPMLADADAGFGGPIHVARTVRLYEGAGVAGLHVEDQATPKRCGHLSGKSLVPPAEMAAKVRAAVDARGDRDFLVVARTDARSVEGFDAAASRARAYRDAGADAIFPEALESADEFARFAREVGGPLVANMTEFGRGPLIDFADLAAMGYAAVLYPLTAFRSAMKAAEDTLADLRDRGSQRGRLGSMMTRARLYEAIDYRGWEAADRAYFGGGDARPADP